MTDLDQDRDHDLGPDGVSDVRDRERLMAAASAHSAMQDALYSQVPVDPGYGRGWRWPLSALLFLAALWITLAPPVWLVGPERPVPLQGDLERGVRSALYLQAQQIEAFRGRTGRLPDSLAQVPMVGGVRYVRSNARSYQLTALRPDGRSYLIYDSMLPTTTFDNVAAGWKP